MADDPKPERISPLQIRPRGSERSELIAQKRDRFLADPGNQDMMEAAGKRVLNQYASGGPVLPRSGGQHAKNARKR